MISAEESVSLNTDAEFASAYTSSVSFVSSHPQLKPKDPLQGSFNVPYGNITASMKNNWVRRYLTKEARLAVSEAFGAENDALFSDMGVFSKKEPEQIDCNLIS
ncbi:hypothetical protein NPIL_130521 [Nephila pilipes]|uniref:Uncharacterized protein n=1 Tax=Nephila pilipes TaxID=299642 RepID=A0A8X6U841_NEPPI|nr:hypothetical protein NPIL_130521 [Nephila pilipes]